MPDFLKDRFVKVLLAKALPLGNSGLTNVVEVIGLRTQFKIEKTLDKTPNSCEVTITNLREDTRAFFQGKGSRISVSAGYLGVNVGQIFEGDARYINSSRQGSDWETKCELGDGERALAYGRVNESFRAGTGLPDIVKKAAGSMGLSVDSASLDALPREQYASGYCMHGPSARELDRVLKSVGMEWSIQDGHIQILKPGGTNTEAVVSLSADTGLVGSPEYGTGEKKDKKSALKVKMLLMPEVKPGGRLQLDTLRHKGLHRVLKVTHTGDTAGGDWYTEAEVEVMS